MKALLGGNDLGDHPERLTFPDGQPHVKVRPTSLGVKIQARIANGDDLLATLLACEAYSSAGACSVSLFVTYLLGARMDRRIASGQPFTLRVIAEMLRGRFDRIEVLDPHSDVACALLDADPISPVEYVREAVAKCGPVALCAPDAGAQKRVETMAQTLGIRRVVQCLKHRDPETGSLSGFRVVGRGDLPERVLIVDDICDGGRTFTAVAEQLKHYGVKWVGLYVTHGIFSRGFDLAGIDALFTTTSYRRRAEYPASVVVVGPDLF